MHDCNAAVVRLLLPEIVSLPEEIDVTNADRVSDEIWAAVRHGVAVVIADMTRTVFCDSRGVRHLLIAHDRAAESGAELRLVIESVAVLRILRILGVDQMLTIYPTLQAALTGHPAPAGDTAIADRVRLRARFAASSSLSQADAHTSRPSPA